MSLFMKIQMITSAASDEKRISKFLEGAIDLVLWLLHPFENYENQSLPTGESATSFSAPSCIIICLLQIT